MGNYPITLRRMVIAKNGVEGAEYFKAGDALMKPGMVCTHDSDTAEVKKCITTTKPFGIVGCDADHDLGTVYAENERIPVWVLGCGVDLYVLCGKGSAVATYTITKGTIIDTQDDTTQTGYGKPKTAFVAITTATNDSTGRGYTTLFWIGTALEGGTISTTNAALYVPVKLSF